MKLQIAGHETVVTPEVRKYVEKKMNKLCRNYKQVIDIDIVLEGGQKKTAKKIGLARAVVKIAGPDINAEASEKTIFAAIDELERKLIRQLEKDKAAHSPKESKVARGKNILRKILRRESQE